jgi:AraC family ethanolamine operon transcriptional activator
MVDGMDRPAAWALSRTFADAEELVRAMRGAAVDYVPLEHGAYETRMTLVQLDGLSVQRVDDRAHITRGTMDLQHIGLLLPMRHTVDPIVNGRPIALSEGLILQPGQEIHALCRGSNDWVSLLLPLDAAAALLEAGGRASAPRTAGAVTMLDPVVVARLQAALGAVTDLVEDPESGVQDQQVLGALGAGLMDAATEAFAGPDGSSAIPRRMRTAIRLVSAAEEYLHAHVSRPIYGADLCAALGVSPRALHAAFVAACGMSPQAYLRRRRLVLVHAALKAGGPGAPLVKSVALSHGFWHLGRFASEYRAQFGQSPSETLAQAHGRIVPAPPRVERGRRGPAPA